MAKQSNVTTGGGPKANNFQRRGSWFASGLGSRRMVANVEGGSGRLRRARAKLDFVYLDQG